MDTSRTAIFDGIVGILREVSAHGDAPVTDATELYFDLGLAGDDLYDVIMAIRRGFGTDFSGIKLGRYAPGEAGNDFNLNLLRKFLEWRGQRTYRSLSVGDIVEAVRVGRWNDR